MSKSSNKVNDMAEIMKALAHSDRLTIMKMLCKSQHDGLTVKSIYEKLHLQQPVVSRHLNILKSAGIVRRIQHGQKTSYCLCMDNKIIAPLIKCFC